MEFSLRATAESNMGCSLKSSSDVPRVFKIGGDLASLTGPHPKLNTRDSPATGSVRKHRMLPGHSWRDKETELRGCACVPETWFWKLRG